MQASLMDLLCNGVARRTPWAFEVCAPEAEYYLLKSIQINHLGQLGLYLGFQSVFSYTTDIAFKRSEHIGRPGSAIP